MKILLLILTALILISNPLLASESVTGVLQVDADKSYRLVTCDNQSFDLYTSNNDVEAQLRRLEANDLIHGLGSVVKNKVIVLDSIDFVGLNRLIGVWRSQDTVFEFKNLTEVSLIKLHEPASANAKKDLKYVISPGFNGGWQFFLLDQSEVTIANLNLKSDMKAKLQFIDSQTGQEKETFLLKKVSTEQ